MIFKSCEPQARGRRATFVSGFGCKLADAIEASCSAYPFFEIKSLETESGGVVELLDGGYPVVTGCENTSTSVSSPVNFSTSATPV